MFGAACALHEDLCGRRTFPQAMHTDARKKIFEQLVNSLAENISALNGQGEKEPLSFEIRIGNRCFCPCHKREGPKTIIEIPSLWLKEFSELFPEGADLRKRGESFKSYSRRLFLKAQEHNNLPTFSPFAEIIAYRVFKFHLRNVLDREKAKQIVAFCLNNELALSMKDGSSIRTQALTEALIVAAVSLPLFYLLGVSLGMPQSHALGSAFAAALIAGCLFKNWREGSLIKNTVMQADSMALSALPECKAGAIYLFENAAKIERWVYDPRYPKTQERIASLNMTRE